MIRRLWARLRAWFRRVVLRRRELPAAVVLPVVDGELGEFDPWAEQRSRPGLWVAIADAARGR